MNIKINLLSTLYELLFFFYKPAQMEHFLLKALLSLLL